MAQIQFTVRYAKWIMPLLKLYERLYKGKAVPELRVYGKDFSQRNKTTFWIYWFHPKQSQ